MNQHNPYDVPYLLPEMLRPTSPDKVWNITFKPTCRADAATYPPLSFAVLAPTELMAKVNARTSLRKYIKEHRHILATSSYWFVCDVQTVEDDEQ